MSSLYIHIPFCLTKCSYCSFNSFVGMETVFERYVQALNKEVAQLSFKQDISPLSTVFFGGGTPTVLSNDQLGRILECCEKYFGFSGEAEVSIEANPKTIDFLKLLSLREYGINRLSLGVQSFVDGELQKLARLHSAQDGWDAIKDAKSAGFDNISIDLMSGIPGQTPESWQWSLETVIALAPQHLSLYQLSIEEGTPFDALLQDGRIHLPEEADILVMDEVTEKMCSTAGLQQYEISNYALAGRKCRHNVNYWENGEYLAIGAGAVAFYKGQRVRNIRDPREYCMMVEEGKSPIIDTEQLDNESSFRETVIMGLRMNRGVSLEKLKQRYGIELQHYYGETLDLLLLDGFAHLGNTHFCLTKKGRRFANQVMSELV